MGIWWFADEHLDEHCNNMLQCFWSYFYMTMREAGIRDILEDASYAHTLGEFRANPPPPSRTKWTRLVHPSVLTGHVSSIPSYSS